MNIELSRFWFLAEQRSPTWPTCHDSTTQTSADWNEGKPAHWTFNLSCLPYSGGRDETQSVTDICLLVSDVYWFAVWFFLWRLTRPPSRECTRWTESGGLSGCLLFLLLFNAESLNKTAELFSLLRLFVPQSGDSKLLSAGTDKGQPLFGKSLNPECLYTKEPKPRGDADFLSQTMFCAQNCLDLDLGAEPRVFLSGSPVAVERCKNKPTGSQLWTMEGLDHHHSQDKDDGPPGTSPSRMWPHAPPHHQLSKLSFK